MKAIITKIIKILIPHSWTKQLLNFKRLASNYGQYYTIKNKVCVDRDKNEIPWFTYPVIEYLNNLDFSQKTILEYGSGNSSIYWSKKVKEIISIEHDKKWFKKIATSLKENQTILLKDNANEYLSAISQLNKKFDVIAIDGVLRAECSRVISNYLNKNSDEGFMIILDNSDWYNNTAKFLKNHFNLIQIDFHGFTPINSYTSTTSIFLSRNFDFKAINNIQPNFSIAALVDSLD